MKKYLLGFAIIAALLAVIIFAQQDKIQLIRDLKQGRQTSAPAETPKMTKSVSAVDLAAGQGLARQDIQRLAGQFEVNCFWISVDECKAFIVRVKGNSFLASALQYAKSNRVTVYARDRFFIAEGWVYINMLAKDADIIKFLTGKNHS